MKKSFPLLFLVLLIFSAFVPSAFAQDTTSAGCSALASKTDSAPVSYSYNFSEGELLAFVVSGPGDFTITVNGNVIFAGSTGGGSYTVSAEGVVDISVDVVGGTGNSEVSVDCTPADEVKDYPPGMICHRPPGNPANAHTINVGAPAVSAHLAHGDTEGPCPEGVDTKIELPSLAAVIFVEPLDGIVKFYSDCTDTCANEIIINLIDLIDFSQVLDGEGNFIILIDEDEEDDQAPYIQFSEIADEGPSVVVFYLHPDPDDSTLGVFQVNIYFDAILVDDNTLLFVAADGTIATWTDQSYWDDDDDDDDD